MLEDMKADLDARNRENRYYQTEVEKYKSDMDEVKNKGVSD